MSISLCAKNSITNGECFPENIMKNQLQSVNTWASQLLYWTTCGLENSLK